MADDRLAVLEQCVAALEREWAELRAATRPPAAPAAPGRPDPLKDHPLFRRSAMDPQALAEHEARIDRILGIDHLEPLDPATVRQMMIDEDGLDPSGTEFSRGIIEMREE